MAKYSRIEVFSTMKQTGLVPLFYHADLSICKQILTACYKGGARLMEFTHRGDFAHEVFGELNKFALSELPDMKMGVGSVTDAASASLYMMLGANFVVTPSLREDVAKLCNRRKVLWLAGCNTLTEIAAAEELGAEIVKLFPGDAVGAKFVKAIKSPCPWTNVMPTGGVSPTEEDLTEWFQAGVICVGMGSKLIPKSPTKSADFSRIETLTSQVIATIKKIKGIGI